MSDPTHRDGGDSLLPGHRADVPVGADGSHGDGYEDVPPARHAGSRRAEKRKGGRGLGCLVLALVMIAGAVGLLYVGVSWVADRLGGGEAEDYDGVASVEECAAGGDVEVTIPSGYGDSQIGNLLEEEGVVASAEAYTSAVAVADGTVRDGLRSMCREMSGEQAAQLLINADYIGSGITIQAGRTAEKTFELLAGATEIPAEDFAAAAEDPAIGLPDSAGGDIEGYLFPDSYNFGRNPTAVSILTQMVDRWKEVAEEVGFVDDAVPGYTQHELLTIASIIEREVLMPEERPAVAEVVYDRLDAQCEGVPAGLLQMDSTVNYLLGSDTGTPYTTAEDRRIDSPYNTYLTPGLPPGPIAAPGRAAMEGAIDPTDEGYCYFVAANDGTNSSVFAADYDEHLENVRRAQGQ